MGLPLFGIFFKYLEVYTSTLADSILAQLAVVLGELMLKFVEFKCGFKDENQKGYSAAYESRKKRKKLLRSKLKRRKCWSVCVSESG